VAVAVAGQSPGSRSQSIALAVAVAVVVSHLWAPSLPKGSIIPSFQPGGSLAPAID